MVHAVGVVLELAPGTVGILDLGQVDILKLDMDAILTILSHASCFPEDLRNQASTVIVVRNRWLCSKMDHWM